MSKFLLSPSQRPVRQPDPEHQPGDPSYAIDRIGTIHANEFKIRALKRNMEQRGQGDCLVLMLDLTDPYAKKIYDGLSQLPGQHDRLGQPVRPGDTLQLVAVPYLQFVREPFSESIRRSWDRCRPCDIRVALLSQGRTTGTLILGDAKMGDITHLVASR